LKPIIDFARKVGAAKFNLDADLVVERGGRYFLLNRDLQHLVRNDFYSAGIYLGKAKAGKFFPSFPLLTMLADCGANSVVVDKKAAWLFICGRDVFAKSITGVDGAGRGRDFVLVLNEFGECLGFGRLTQNLASNLDENEVAVRNVSDIGDFLRREDKSR